MRFSADCMPALAGAQIAKMTPFRSFVVTIMTALTLTIMSLLKFKGGTITYVIVSVTASPAPHACWLTP